MVKFIKVAIFCATILICRIGAAQDTFYVVEKGDTLSGILLSLGVTSLYGENGKVNELVNRNQIKDIYTIQIGEKIWINESEIELKCNYAVQGRRIRVFQKANTPTGLKKLKKIENACASHRPYIDVIGEQEIITQPIIVEQKQRAKSKESRIIPEEPFWKKKNYFKIKPYVDYSRIRFTDNSNRFTGIILSEANGGVYSEITYYIKENLAYLISFDFDQQRFATNSGRRILNNDIFTTNLGVGLLKHVNRKLDGYFQFKYGDDLFFEAPDTETVTLDNSQNFKLELGLNYNVVDTPAYHVDAELSFRIISPTQLESYSADNGMSYKVGTSIGREFYNLFEYYNKIDINLGVNYENVEKDTDLFTQVHQHIQYYMSFKVSY